MIVRLSPLVLPALILTLGCAPALRVRPAPVQSGQRYLVDVDAVGEVTAQSPALGTEPVKVVVGLQTKALEEVLETRADGRVAKARITFAVDRNVRRLGERDTSGPGLLDGRTFVLTATPDSGYAIGAEGPVPAAEEKRIRVLYPEFGEPDAMVQALEGRELEVGKDYPELARALLADLERPQHGMSNHPPVKRMSVVFVERRGDEAVFAVTLEHEADPARAQLGGTHTGELTVHLTDATTSFTLEGPFSVDVPGVTTTPGTMKSIYRVRKLAAGEQP
jgi:hypothetical protein